MSDVKKDEFEIKTLKTECDEEEISEINPISNNSASENALESANDKIESLEQYVKEIDNEILIVKAEMENIRKRAERDVQNSRKFGIEKLVKELFSVADSLDQALKHELKTDEAIVMKDGIEMTSKILTNILKKNGLEELDPIGEKFDPNSHEAMAVMPNIEYENNTILEVFQKGYILNGRVVRAAKVVVVKN